jgi:hypothetical protein
MADVAALSVALREMMPPALRASRREAWRLRARLAEARHARRVMVQQYGAALIDNSRLVRANDQLEETNGELWDNVTEVVTENGELKELLVAFASAASRGELPDQALLQRVFARWPVLAPATADAPAAPPPEPSDDEDDDDSLSEGGSSGMYSSDGSGMYD